MPSIKNSDELSNVLNISHSHGPPYYVTKDGGVLCTACVKNNTDLIYSSINIFDDPQWEVIGYGINWEDDNLYCDHCNEKIEPEYE